LRTCESKPGGCGESPLYIRMFPVMFHDDGACIKKITWRKVTKLYHNVCVTLSFCRECDPALRRCYFLLSLATYVPIFDAILRRYVFRYIGHEGCQLVLLEHVSVSLLHFHCPIHTYISPPFVPSILLIALISFLLALSHSFLISNPKQNHTETELHCLIQRVDQGKDKKE